MKLRVLMGSLAGAGLVLILASPPTAHGYVQGSSNPMLEHLDQHSAARASTVMSKWEATPTGLPGSPRDVRDPLRGPFGEEPIAPIPEPATLTLVSLGLLILGAAMRKRRGPDAPKLVRS